VPQVVVALEQRYRYPTATRPDCDGRPALACDNASSEWPLVLAARALCPGITVRALGAVARKFGEHFYTPLAMHARILCEADPVMPVRPLAVRLEGFSASCGVYARADLDYRAPAATERRTGTTNADFGPELCADLASVGHNARYDIVVGASAVVVANDYQAMVEHKVLLPLRWINGFYEVQHAWPNRNEPASLAVAAVISETEVESELAVLATTGNLDYELTRARWLHQMLPFDQEMIGRLNLRLVAALSLVAAGAVRSDLGEAEVAGEGVTHRITEDRRPWNCTCSWHPLCGGACRPCKHFLAVGMALEHMS
jgi:hypothetical protein